MPSTITVVPKIELNEPDDPVSQLVEPVENSSQNWSELFSHSKESYKIKGVYF